MYYPIGYERNDCNFGMDVCEKALLWFEDWINIKYEINKLDLIGIPDFGAGAMENWGLITFRPELLYCNDKIDIDHESWMGPYWTFHPYTDIEHDMIKQVNKVIPTEYTQVKPRTKSKEPQGTYTVSPVSNWNTTK